MKTPEEMAKYLDMLSSNIAPTEWRRRAADDLTAWRDEAVEAARDAAADGEYGRAVLEAAVDAAQEGTRLMQERLQRLIDARQPPAPEDVEIKLALYAGYWQGVADGTAHESSDETARKCVDELRALLAHAPRGDGCEEKARLYDEIIAGSQLCLDDPKWRLPETVCDLVAKTMTMPPEPPKEDK
jgi:hypothetical protein